MFKLLLGVLFSANLFAQNIEHNGKKFEVYAGPSDANRDHFAGSQTIIGAKFGGDTFSGALDLGLGKYVSIKPKFVVDLNYYYKNNELVMGPTFDIGPSFNFNLNNFFLNFVELGIGYRIGYSLNKTMGITFTPFHITSSFIGWKNGGPGIEADIWMYYQTRFGFYWLL